MRSCAVGERVNLNALLGPRGAIRVPDEERGRNRKCPCGSGRRAKSCCESHNHDGGRRVPDAVGRA